MKLFDTADDWVKAGCHLGMSAEEANHLHVHPHVMDRCGSLTTQQQCGSNAQAALRTGDGVMRRSHNATARQQDGNTPNVQE